LTGGGSGGHVTPILSLAHELKAKDSVRTIYIGHKGDDPKALVGGELDVMEYVRGGKFRRYHGESLAAHLLDIKTLLLNVRDFFRVIVATVVAWRLLKKYQPDVVFSKGGFVAVPVGIAAHILKIPIVTHDSDSVPGLANRIIGRWAQINATGMPDGLYPYPKNKIRYVGVPITDKIKTPSPVDQENYKKEFGVPPGSKLLVASGGGNGSRTINELLLASAQALLETDKDLHIINAAGRTHANDLRERYRKLLDDSSRVKVLGYENEFYKLIEAADLIVGRAGATFINEFAAASKPCIIIPSPFLSGGHQLKNADELSKNDAAVILSNDVRAGSFIKTVKELLSSPDRRQQLATNLHKLAKTDAAGKIADIILKVAKGRASTTDAT